MTNEPVIAADGHTYELAAIAEWFEKQNMEVGAAKRQLAAGHNSKHAKAIVDRGIVSPVTRARTDNLALSANSAVRTMARNAAKTNRVIFGSLS